MDRQLTHNMLWTWDARMRWVPSQDNPSRPAMAIPETVFPYPYDRKFFVDNYKEMIRSVASWPEIDSIIIWGLLRDSHGGISAAQEVCEFARDQGVQILAGIGSSGYGGVYYEGDHSYNAATFMRQRPDLVVKNKKIAAGREVDRGDTLHPVHPEVVQWIQEGIRWLFETVPVAGINLEIGDFFVGEDPLAREHREQIGGVQEEFFKALAAHYRLIVPELIKEHPDRFFSFASYADCDAKTLRENQKFLDYLPPELACQSTLSNAEEFDSARIHDPGRIHFGFSHLFSEANNTHQRDLSRELAQACRTARKRGLQGLVIYGEQSGAGQWGQINYAAFRKFLHDPDAAEAVSPVLEKLETAPV